MIRSVLFLLVASALATEKGFPDGSWKAYRVGSLVKAGDATAWTSVAEFEQTWKEIFERSDEGSMLLEMNSRVKPGDDDNDDGPSGSQDGAPPSQTTTPPSVAATPKKKLKGVVNQAMEAERQEKIKAAVAKMQGNNGIMKRPITNAEDASKPPNAVAIRVRRKGVIFAGQYNYGFVFTKQGGGAPDLADIVKVMKWTVTVTPVGTTKPAFPSELEVKYYQKTPKMKSWKPVDFASYPGWKMELSVGYIRPTLVAFDDCDPTQPSFVECGSTVTNRAQPEEGVSHVLEREAARQSAKWTQKNSAVASVDIAGFGAEVDAGVLETAAKQTAVPPTAAKRKHPSLQPLPKK